LDSLDAAFIHAGFGIFCLVRCLDTNRTLLGQNAQKALKPCFYSPLTRKATP
jgi:hypothetical protein